MKVLTRFKKWWHIQQLEWNGHKRIECEQCGEMKWVHKVMVTSFGMWGGFVCWECKLKAYKAHNLNNNAPNFSEYGMDREISYCHDSFVAQKLRERPINLYCCRLTPELTMEKYSHKLNQELSEALGCKV